MDMSYSLLLDWSLYRYAVSYFVSYYITSVLKFVLSDVRIASHTRNMADSVTSTPLLRTLASVLLMCSSFWKCYSLPTSSSQPFVHLGPSHPV